MTGATSRPLVSALVGGEAVGAIFSNEAELAALLQVEAALAAAEAQAGLIEADAASAIAETCDNFRPDWPGLAEGLAKDGVIVPELVRQLRATVGASHAAAVHKGATSQDIIDTALMLRLKHAAATFMNGLGTLAALLRQLKTRHGAVPLMAHTRMQRAVPFTVADKIDTWVAPLERQTAALDLMNSDLFVVQLGGPVGTRASFNGMGDAIARAMADMLGLGDAPCWHSQRDRIAVFASWLSVTSGIFGKIGQDIALMAQNEIGDVGIVGGGGSSAMPHKSNPVQAELLVALARLNAGLLGTLNQALVHENERSGAAWTLEWLVLPQMTVATAAGMEKAATLFEGLHFLPGEPDS
ncbi:MAG: 3-carboxy-cis,cis-muconate cycloisomerase [Mesorhizobium sp.]|uniref:3-carboxy-cis,cis-muconate cycloisomerase n=2 Tax=Mesorhizobium sp. TaxID=1871066 RepID=UPI000FE84814|nr:3-carboxy-cis,cis-muconate cycloisomerase [Mesorhizobium sp.]RWD42525.1 MAG: 3-carboxy-cis,cis-muconate cycloisomerase [Mesorhizobium sp.]RWF52805.1 MAG: 3-carboxy-cis,cis-muconate cycloisomerase [Mesorhizobium sp.]